MSEGRQRSSKVLALAATFAALFSLSFSSCSQSPGAKEESPAVAGAALVGWGAYVYALGGYNSAGSLSSEVWYASVGEGGVLGKWIRCIDLPEAIANASCVSFGNMVYLVGGRDSDGLLGKIYYTMIDTDGVLGFTAGWALSGRALPTPRESAAPLVANGRLYLIGGDTSAGPSSSIITAAFWGDGEIGHWYDAPYPLPASGTGFSATLYGGNAWVVGGGSTATYSAELGSNGLIGSWATGYLSGAAVSFPALAMTADGLISFGGIDQTTKGYANTRIYGNGSWSTSSIIDAYGPSCVVTADSSIVLAPVNNSSPSVKVIAASQKRADTPRVSPGGGIIRTGKSPSITAFPGDTVRYTSAAYGTKSADPTAADPDTNWAATVSSIPAVSAPASYAFRAFRSGAEPSEVVYAEYRTLSMGLIMLIQKAIYPEPGASGYTAYSLTETYSDGSTSAVSSVWYEVVVSASSTLSFGWVDKNGEPAGSGYGAPVSLSLFEDASCSTPTLDSNGTAMYQLTGGYSNPVSATLEPGVYYLNVASIDGSSGGSFGLCVGD